MGDGYWPLLTPLVPFELRWSLLSAEYGANVKKRATLVRGPKTTQQYKSLYWAELGLGAWARPKSVQFDNADRRLKFPRTGRF